MRELRRSREIAIQTVAYATGINVSMLSQAESGKRDLTDEQLTKIAKFYRVPKDDLMRDAIVRVEAA